MKQPVKGETKKKKKKMPSKRKDGKIFVKHSSQEYGTSKLERDFAHDFLDKFGIDYIYQYEAKDIKRFYDFAVVEKGHKYQYETKDGIKCVKDEQWIIPDMLIEVDGGYWHSDPRVVKEEKMTPTQKHNRFVDSIKDKWAQLHHIPLLRVWEFDIRKNPAQVVEEMSKYVSIVEKKSQTRANKKKPH